MKTLIGAVGVVMLMCGHLALAGGFVLVSQPEPRPRVSDEHLILHYIDSKSGRMTYVGELPGVEDHDSVGLFKADYSSNRLIYSTCGDTRKETNLRVVDFGQTIKVRDLTWPGAGSWTPGYR